ncbi:MAG: bifunctional (p)ppGpp synthetase/guanosine-3',5'-bis(diphosphate) 3'-pyrophosphohydrolase, partial [Clostridia bacterium]|nr:bifunctional (p)ppGpp synthetase/guanosine-3',5'-bis(diphosphate) 3'-pyrophosphohydrolase [Clostridia bacterium]
ISLPQGATVIDFAYSIHTAVGNKMVGAKINGMIVPIDRSPENGEIVEIITSSSSKGPSRDWLSIVKTSEARNKIRQWFKKETRVENVAAGKEIIDAEMKKYARSLTEDEMADVVNGVAKKTGYASAEDLYNTVGYGGMSVSKIAIKLHDEYKRMFRARIAAEQPVATDAEVIAAAQRSDKPKNIRSNSGIIVDGESGCQVKFAKCCNPLPGDSIIGFITKGFGISIHKRDCPNVIEGMGKPGNEDRWITADWEKGENQFGKDLYEALLQVHTENRIGMLASVTTALAEMKVSILQINCASRADDTAIISMKISCKNTDHYSSIVSRLRGLSGVLDIMRGFST